MTVSSRTDRSAFAKSLIEDRRRMQDQDLQKHESAINYQAVVDKKAGGHGCKDCAFILKSGYFWLCKEQNMKQVRLYNICHRHQL